ncbi:MAG: SAM-dependent methyltransferase [Candidatus Promineifilaceae bacterium]|jgi:SAM-dependent methyltransferase
MPQIYNDLSDGLWRVYRRSDPPEPWELYDGNLPWNDPAFSERMLREHLDQSHNAASRTHEERKKALDWLWGKLDLQAGDHVLDFTCGPGLYSVDLARKGCQVTGIDFSPASIAFARSLAVENNVEDSCEFIEQDVRESVLPADTFDGALFIYGQMAVFRREKAQALLAKIAASLKPGAKLAVELLIQDRVDKQASTWWYTDDKGLWGESPFLHLGERNWLEEERISVERFYVIDLTTQDMLEVNLSDQTYAVSEMVDMFKQAGFTHVDVYEAWDNIDLYDREEWVVYIAQK